MGSRRALFAAAAVLAAAVLLGGCAGAFGPRSHADEVVRGIPPGWQGAQPDPIEPALAAGWLDDGRFGIITMGSSSCPPIAGALEVVDGGQVAIAFDPTTNEVCTADLGATTHVFVLPDEADERPVSVVVTFTESGQSEVLELP